MNNERKNNFKLLCCVGCFNSEGIKAYISELGWFSKCDFCEQEQLTVCVYTLRSYMENSMPYIPVSSLKFKGINDEDDDAIRLPLKEVFDKHETFSDLEVSIKDKLLSALFPEVTVIKIADIEYDNAFAQGVNEIVQKINPAVCRPRSIYLQTSWNSFKGHIKEVGRFFDFVDDSRFKREPRLKYIAELFTKLVKNLPKGTIIHRARKLDCKLFDWMDGKNIEGIEDIFKELGPPPKDKYQLNRMNPPGIPYFYGSSDAHTCVAETTPNISERLLLGEFETIKPLNIIDLSKAGLRTLEANLHFEDKDIFHPLYWGFIFLKDFTTELSIPVLPDIRELSYIPTQVLSEYIRYLGYDGFIFTSSHNRNYFDQNALGQNYTLFCGPYGHYDDGVSKYFNAEYDIFSSHRRIPPVQDFLDLKNHQFIEVSEMKLAWETPWEIQALNSINTGNN